MAVDEPNAAANDDRNSRSPSPQQDSNDKESPK